MADILLPHLEDTGRILGKGIYGDVLEMLLYGTKVSGIVMTNDSKTDVRSHLSKSSLLTQQYTKLSNLRHPNLVQFLGVHYKSGSDIPILVMESLPMSLTQCLEQYKMIPHHIKKSILLDISLGLLYLHKQTPPIVHRDLTANNVLLTSSLKAKLSYFGDIFQSVTICQSPFTPPDVWNASNNETAQKWDVYSFGIVAFQVYTQQTELQQCSISNYQQLLNKVTEIVDPPVKDIVCKCLQYDPHARPHMSTIYKYLEKTSSISENVIDMPRKYNELVEDNSLMVLLDKVKKASIAKRELLMKFKAELHELQKPTASSNTNQHDYEYFLLQWKQSILLSAKQELKSTITMGKPYKLGGDLTSTTKDKLVQYCNNDRRQQHLQLLKIAYSICLRKAQEKVQVELMKIFQLPPEDLVKGEQFSLSSLMIERIYAFSILLKCCTLNRSSLPDKFKDINLPKTLPNGISPDLYCSVVSPLVNTAFQLSWKMVTMTPPGVMSTPSIYNEEWHEPNRQTYDEQYNTRPLIYYRPFLCFGDMIEYTVKGRVGNVSSQSSCNSVGCVLELNTKGSVTLEKNKPVLPPKSTTKGKEKSPQAISLPTNPKPKPKPVIKPKSTTKPSFNINTEVKISSDVKICVTCQTVIHNEELSSGGFCHDKCRMCCLCSLRVSPTLSGKYKGTLLQNGQWLCQKCGACNQCLKSIEANDLAFLMKIGNNVWHSYCFKCTKCYDNLANDNYSVNDEGALICSKCMMHRQTRRQVHQLSLQLKAGKKGDNMTSKICIKCEKAVSEQEMVKLVTGDICHMKCCRCSFCNEGMSTSSSEGTCRRLENGKWICQNCGTCSQCLKFIKAEDLKDARRQGYKIWHSQCFRCIKCHRLLQYNYTMRNGQLFCTRC